MLGALTGRTCVTTAELPRATRPDARSGRAQRSAAEPCPLWSIESSVINIALAAMHSGVACRAHRNQILLCIGSRMAAELPVVHLKIRHHATVLTPPAIATQDLLAQTFVRQRVQPRASGFGANHSQDAFSRRFSSFVELGCTIEALSVLFSTSQRQSPDSNSLFFDDDNAAFAQRLLHHRHSP